MDLFEIAAGKYTKQEIYDYVIAKLREQGRPSMSHDGGSSIICAYRGDGNAKCAIGHLIPDDRYRGEEMEGDGVVNLLIVLGLRTNFAPDMIKFLEHMQESLHDSWGEHEVQDDEIRNDEPPVKISPEKLLEDLEHIAARFCADHEIEYTDPAEARSPHRREGEQP